MAHQTKVVKSLVTQETILYLCEDGKVYKFCNVCKDPPAWIHTQRNYVIVWKTKVKPYTNQFVMLQSKYTKPYLKHEAKSIDCELLNTIQFDAGDWVAQLL